jgi:outer membrane receptor protein involved in Fe transport
MRKCSLTGFYVFISLIGLALYSISWAEVTGKIAGTVKDAQSGEGIPGVNVMIEGTQLGAVTNTDGYYSIINVSPGSVNLRFTCIGYQAKVVEGIRVSVGLTSKIDAKLSTKALEMGDVVVTADRPVVEMDRTNTAAYLASEEITQLPVTEVSELIQLQAGVTQDADGQLHFRGGRSGEVAYLVDGVSVTNRFDGGSAIEIENDVIQELQVISGTFNAEYGQAQSGIVNIVSKTPDNKYSGRISYYSGAHFSKQTDKFIGIDDPMNNLEYNVQGNLTGPVPLTKKLSFYAFGRYNKDNGWINGERRYNPQDSWRTRVFEQWYNLNYPERQFGQYLPYKQYSDSLHLFTGDGAIVPMNPSEKISVNTKLYYQMASNMRLFYNFFMDRISSKEYDNVFRYAPDGIPTIHKNAFNHTVNFTHTLKSNMFYELNLSYFGEDRKTYLYESENDLRYQDAVPSLMGYKFGGTDNDREHIDFQNYLAQLDMTWQIDKVNLTKFGISAKKFNLDYQQLTTTTVPNSYYLPTTKWTTFDEYYGLSHPPVLLVPERSTLLNNQYTHNPFEFAVYAQDKLELGELIANIGLRFDYFDPDGVVPVNPRAAYNAVLGGLETKFVKASKKYQLSPRLGLAFPISDKGVIHVSYGHFLQIPHFQYLYYNSEFELSSGYKETIMGNADLEPERTVAYEVGLQQQLAKDFGLELTVYSKDIRNLLGQEIFDTLDERVYFRYANRDYGNVKGITVAVEKKPSGFISGRLDYTYQVARGNASDPNAVFLQNQSTRPAETQKQVIPLNWDQTHTINATVRVGSAKNWTMSLIGRLGTGLPYTADTPQERQLETVFENNERKPMSYNVDIFAQKYFKLGNQRLIVFARCFNIFDTANHLQVFASTGFADRTFRYPEQERIDSLNGVYALSEVDSRPHWFSEPRKVQLGVSIEF